MIEESRRQYRLAWELHARASVVGAVMETSRLDFCIAGLPLPLFNAAFVKRPLESEAEVAETGAEAIAEFSRLGLGGMLTLPASWLPKGGAERLEALGMRLDFRMMGMRTARLNDPDPGDIRHEVQEISGSEAAEVMAAVNGRAYGIEEPLWKPMVLPGLWQPPARAYRIEMNGQPAAVGAAVTLEDICYVMCIATIESARNQGAATAIVRRAWHDARQKDGAKFTVLHATDKGRPVYARLGYTAVADFPGFVWEPLGR